jgi:competence CoiA-like predicted nuclease
MLFGIDGNGDRILALKNHVAFCPCCGEELIPKCGLINARHWSHKKNSNCNLYKPETEWHIALKEYALRQGCEIEKRIGNNIADIYIPSKNCVVELQNSTITGNEIIERTNHIIFQLSENQDFENYIPPKIIWIFNMINKFNKKQLVLLKNNSFQNIYNIKFKWNKKIIDLLFEKNGYPIYGDVFLNYNHNLFFKYKRIFNSGKGYGECFNLVDFIPVQRFDPILINILKELEGVS